MRPSFEKGLSDAGVVRANDLPFDELRDTYRAVDGLQTGFGRTDLAGKSPTELKALFDQLSVLKRGIPIFMFQEGDDETAATAFREIAKLSSGICARFDSGSGKQLADLLRAVGRFATTGGDAHLALSQARQPSVRAFCCFVECGDIALCRWAGHIRFTWPAGSKAGDIASRRTATQRVFGAVGDARRLFHLAMFVLLGYRQTRRRRETKIASQEGRFRPNETKPPRDHPFETACLYVIQ